MDTTTTLTGIKKLAVYAALFGGLGAAALGIGTGLAQASTSPAVGATSTVRQVGDQEVVSRGTVIPIHGDDEHPHTSTAHRGM